MQLTTDSPFVSRFSAWAAERFPALNAIFCLVLYGTALLWGRALTSAGPISVGVRDLGGFFACLGFLFMLRVFDEHKDYELDLRNHPQRVLQRGLITLGHLKVAGAIAIATQLAVSLALDGGFGVITQRWLLVIGWSALMAKEFFIGHWLSERLLLYAISHMVVMPMAVLWLLQMGAGPAPLANLSLLLPVLSFLSGFTFEISRKTRGPEAERDTVQSYTQILGTRGAAVMVVGLCLGAGATLLTMLVGQRGATPWLLLGLAAAATVGPLIPTLTFLGKPIEKTARKAEALLGLQIVLMYLLLSAAILSSRGVLWR